jgi:lipopolysaccharide export system permease protein
MLIASRYILRQISAPLLGAMAIGLLVLLAERLVRLLDFTLGKKNSFAIVFEMLAYLVPHYLGLAVPAALFLGLLFGFNKLSRTSELDAFMAAGVGLHQLVRPVLMLAITLMVASTIIFGWLQPHARYAYRAILFTVKNVDIFYLAEEGVFMQAGNRTFILDKLERGTRKFERIFLFEDRKEKGSETITARSGQLVDVEGEQRPVLRLESGHRLQVEGWPDQDPNNPTPKQVIGNFENGETPLGSANSKLFRARGTDERELTLTELIDPATPVPEDSNPNRMRAEFHKRLVNILSIPVLTFLAVPFALGRRRGMRAYRFGVALIILIAYHEIIEQGAVLVQVGRLSPYVALWLPFTLLTLFAGFRYYRACFTVPSARIEPMVDRAIEWIMTPFRRKKAGARR